VTGPLETGVGVGVGVDVEPPVVLPPILPGGLPFLPISEAEASAPAELPQALSRHIETTSAKGADFSDFPKVIKPQSRAIESLLHALSEGTNSLERLNFLLPASELIAIFSTPGS
jgi:hypothetical protein